MHVNQSFVQKVVNQSSFIGTAFPQDAYFSVDTRTLQPGDVFVALPGKKVDGHAFVKQALAKKAAAIIASEKYQEAFEESYVSSYPEVSFVFVPDTKQALIDLARQWRQQFSIPVIGITGSVGKTSTKELLASIVRQQGKPFLATQGNQNTAIGVSLNILKLRQDHTCAIFEMGISESGDMDELSDIVQPTLGVITKIAPAHMAGLGAMERIAVEKKKIFAHFAPENIGIINGDQEVLTQFVYPHPIVKFGRKTTNQIQVRKLVVQDNTISCVIKIYKEKFSLLVPGCNVTYVENMLPAIAAAYFLGIKPADIMAAVSKPVVVHGRFEMRELSNQARIINDCYNANPESMKKGLEAFHMYKTSRTKVVVLGDMLELGSDAVFWHRQLGRNLARLKDIQHVIFVGDMVDSVQDAAGTSITIQHAENWKEAEALVTKYISPDTVLYFKSSHGVGLYNIIDRLA